MLTLIAPHHQPRHLGSFTQTSRTSGSQTHLLILGRALNIDSRKGAPWRVLTTLIHALYHAPSPSSRTLTTRLGAQGSHMGAHTHKPHTFTSRCLALPGPLLPLPLHTGLMPPIVFTPARTPAVIRARRRVPAMSCSAVGLAVLSRLSAFAVRIICCGF